MYIRKFAYYKYCLSLISAVPVRLVVKVTSLRIVKFWDLNYIFRIGEAKHVASGTQLDRGKYWSMMTAGDIVDSYQCSH